MRLFVIAAAAFLALPAYAESGPLEQAVSFVTTGSDSSSVLAVDRPNCIFQVSQEQSGTIVQEYKWHFNAIDTKRINLRPAYGGMMGNSVTTNVHGSSTILELLDPGEGDNAHWRSYSDREYIVSTDEYPRLARAWQYIYSHGCKARSSNF